MRLLYRGGNFTSLDIEVSPEEIDALADEDAVTSDEASDWCRALGLPVPHAIPTLPLPHQIAQKLHACTAPDTNDWTNDRVHDLVDLQIATERHPGDHRDIKTAAVRLFASRNGHPWPPTVIARDGWTDRYRSSRPRRHHQLRRRDRLDQRPDRTHRPRVTELVTSQTPGDAAHIR